MVLFSGKGNTLGIRRPVVEGTETELVRRFPLLVAGLLAGLSLATFCNSVFRAEQSNCGCNPADVQMIGTVHTSANTTVPGATLRVTETSTGKAWITGSIATGPI